MQNWALLLLAAGGIRLAYALLGAGMARSKNSAGMVLRNIVDLCIAILAAWAIGNFIAGVEPAGWVDPLEVSLQYGVATAQLPAALLHESGGSLMLVMAALISTGAAVGVSGERARFWPICMAPLLLAGLIVPLVLRWITTGWLGGLGYVDAGWASAMHLPAAVCALVVAALVGPRTGKYNRDGSANAIPGHAQPMAGVAVMTMMIAIVLYMASLPPLGAGRVILNLLLAGAAGAMTALIFSQVRYGKPDTQLVYAGLLGAVIAASAAGGIWPLGAVAIGAVAGLMVPLALIHLDVRWRIDDLTGGIAMHGVGAVLGVLAAGLLARDLTIPERMRLVGVQALGLMVVVVLTVAVAGGVFWALQRLVGLRAKEADEYDGLDIAEHDINAYPDFQQTMIKSYHLREA